SFASSPTDSARMTRWSAVTRPRQPLRARPRLALHGWRRRPQPVRTPPAGTLLPPLPGEADDARRRARRPSRAEEVDGRQARSFAARWHSLLREPLRETPVPALRRRQVEDHIAARAAIAPTAARNELQFLKAALRAAQSRGQQVDIGIFDIDPIRVEPREGQALDDEQLLGLGSWLPERIKRVVPFCGTVGLRFTEAITRTDDRVDREAGTMFIPGRLNKSRRPKPIPLARVEVQLLREQLLVRPPGTRVVFATEAGGVYSKSGFRSVWLPALLAGGLAHEEKRDGRTLVVADFRFHWLRHTAISLMARAGMKPELIAERVG